MWGFFSWSRRRRAHASARRRRDADRAAGRGVLRQLRLLKVRGVWVLPAWIFAIGTKKGSAGPWQPLRPTATPSVDSAYQATRRKLLEQACK